MKLISLGKNRYAKVDDEDFEYLNQWTWGISNGYVARKEFLGYVDGHRKWKQIYMHRTVMSEPDIDVDHKFGDKFDNRKSQLRVVTRSQNNMNSEKKARCSSKFKGVCWFSPRQTWRTRITVNGKDVFCRYFKTEIEAARAYNEKAKEIFGEFAKLNVI